MIMTREEQARGFLENTQVSPLWARLTVICFWLMIFAAPLYQLCRESAEKGKAVEFGVLRLLPDKSRMRRVRSVRDAGKLFASPQEIKDFETSMEDGQYLSRALRPWAQYVLTVMLDTGNEKALTGRNGELFYSEELKALLEPDPGRAQKAVGEILKLNEYLKTRGVTLIVMPVPNKLYIYPERFASGAWASDESLDRLLAGLRERGCAVCDLFPVFRNNADRDLFLKCDTHWTEFGLSLAAESLAEMTGPLGSPVPARQALAANRGDIYDMLQLPRWQKKYKCQTVLLRQPARMPKDSGILLLGDSYSNIYSDSSLKWGKGAGLAERLFIACGTGVDKLALNAGGASASRKALYKDLVYSAKNHTSDILEGKDYVVYEFAQREIALGDWDILDWTKIPYGD